MKKLAIAGASVVLAAMPVVGTYAAQNSFTDTLTVTVNGGCTLQNSQDTTAGDYTHSNRTFSDTIAAGTVGYLNADSTGAATTGSGNVKLSCNSTDGTKTWTVNVAVSGLTDSNINKTIAGGDAINGTTSAWAIKANATGLSGTATNNFADYRPASNGVFLSDVTSSTAITFNPSYRIYVAPNQDPGTYEGTATYTVTLAN